MQLSARVRLEIRDGGAARQLTTGELYETISRHFTHFIDLNRQLAGPRVRPDS